MTPTSAMAGLCLAGALVTALGVSDGRKAGTRLVPRAPEGGCAIACPEPAAATATPPVPVTGGKP